MLFYEKAAMQGYAPAQWVFGIDTLYGVGVEKIMKKESFLLSYQQDKDTNMLLTS
ncbi:MAG: hypothetical protein HZT40_01575 [Candidatus Thiothrix singaporensis]|uniref:Uncharacterized protein n=1 Tax=Candidatus Thiothrix singaporensis TaxID=2799669 RepID=A0A7L6AN33_9GAMM|nr:MAG: hypothetical protein HZT40_01575 [Candidatus Thiothrix singaporensis]